MQGTSANPSAVAEVVAPPAVEAVEDQLDSAPDSDDIEFMELVEYVVDKLSGGDEGVSNIRKNKLMDFIQDKDKEDWKNRDARANRAQLEELKDIEGGSGDRGFRPTVVRSELPARLQVGLAPVAMVAATSR